MRLIVTDNSTAARTMADRIAGGKARGVEVHRVPVFDADLEGRLTRVIGLGGLLFAPVGDPPRWQPARRAPANALRLLARSAESLLLATDDPLLAAQAREVACEGRPTLLRRARVGDPWSPDRQVDDLAAAGRAVALEAAAVVAAYMDPVDAHLGLDELAALGLAGDGPVDHRVLAGLGVYPAAARRLAERGYLVGDPAFRSPAGAQVCGAVDARLLHPATAAAIGAWVDAVARGALTRDVALGRIRDLVGGMRRPARVDGLDAGRLVGTCPECGDWMGGARGRIRCLGCGWTFHLPRGVEALAVPGERCAVCAAPMILPVVRGRRDRPRCPDAAGCPTRLEAPVGA